MIRAWLPLVTTLAVCASTFAQVPRIGPQVRVNSTLGFAANETTAAASEIDPLTIVVGWNDGRVLTPGVPSTRAGFSISFDGGATWQPDFLLLPPNPPDPHSEGDPMTAFDNQTGTLWAGFVQFAPPSGIYVARLDFGATEFNQAVPVFIGPPPVDKPWMAAGPHPDTGLTRLYVAYHSGLGLGPVSIQSSDDLGDSWNPPVTLNMGQGPLPRLDPTGNLYLVYWDLQKEVLFTRSVDGGVTFDPEKIIRTRNEFWPGGQDCPFVPGDFRIPQFNYLAVHPNGTLYVVYMDIIGADGNVDLFLTTSMNEGLSWDMPRLIDFDPASPGDQFFPWIEVDRRGFLHVVFLDTRDPPQDDAAPDALIHVYYMYSDDGGFNWNEFRLTQAPWNSSNDGSSVLNFIGDYLGMTVAGHRVYPVYPHGPSNTPPPVLDPDIYTNVVDFCPWDCGVIDDLVNIFDSLEMFAQWTMVGTSCDFDGGGVGITDRFEMFANWGACPGSGLPAPLTLEQELADACLTQDDWDEFVDVMTDPGSTQAEKDNYDCWMRHYINDCNRCLCFHRPNMCPGPDPFSRP